MGSNWKWCDKLICRVLCVIAVLQLLFLLGVDGPKTTWQDFRETSFMAMAFWLFRYYEDETERLKGLLKEPNQ